MKAKGIIFGQEGEKKIFGKIKVWTKNGTGLI